MKYLKTFLESQKSIPMWDAEWEEMLPEKITVYKGQEDGVKGWVYSKSNIMINADMLQITYDNPDVGCPDTFEIDIYTVQDDSSEERTDFTIVKKLGNIEVTDEDKIIKNLRLDVDLTWGEQMAAEFSISKDGLKVIQTSSIGSKFDPTNTVFGLDDISIQKLCDFFNRFNHGIKLSVSDFIFLKMN
jgi:hypothetical protein